MSPLLFSHVDDPYSLAIHAIRQVLPVINDETLRRVSEKLQRRARLPAARIQMGTVKDGNDIEEFYKSMARQWHYHFISGLRQPREETETYVARRYLPIAQHMSPWRWNQGGL